MPRAAVGGRRDGERSGPGRGARRCEAGNAGDLLGGSSPPAAETGAATACSPAPDHANGPLRAGRRTPLVATPRPRPREPALRERARTAAGGSACTSSIVSAPMRRQDTEPRLRGPEKLEEAAEPAHRRPSFPDSLWHARTRAPSADHADHADRHRDDDALGVLGRRRRRAHGWVRLRGHERRPVHAGYLRAAARLSGVRTASSKPSPTERSTPTSRRSRRPSTNSARSTPSTTSWGRWTSRSTPSSGSPPWRPKPPPIPTPSPLPPSPRSSRSSPVPPPSSAPWAPSTTPTASVQHLIRERI